MNDEVLLAILAELKKISALLEQNDRKAPNYKLPLEQFAKFDWNGIGAKVIKSDRYGVAVVEWAGQLYVRRSPDNAYGAVVYFSRCVGKDETGRNQYERLITFAPNQQFSARPVSRQVEEFIN